MNRSPVKRWLSLGLAVMVIWALFGYALPLLTNSFDSTRQLAAYIDSSGIDTGQFYYTGVEAVAHAEAGARGSIFYYEKRARISETDTFPEGAESSESL